MLRRFVSLVSRGMAETIPIQGLVEVKMRVLAAIFVLVVLAPNICGAEEFLFPKVQPGLTETSFLTGYGENYHIPACMKAHFGIDVATLRYARYTSPSTQVGVELFAGLLSTNNGNLAGSAMTSFRKYFQVRNHYAIGYDLGFGLIHLQDRIEGLATHTNFTEYVGVIWQFSTGGSGAFDIEYRFSHVSNAGIARPNVGINSGNLLVGHSWYR